MSIKVLHDITARAVRFSRLPGVTKAETRRRFKLSARALDAALREHPNAWPGEGDLVLATLTHQGEFHDGPPIDCEGIAAWLRYVNKDDSTASSVRAVVDGLVADGVLSEDGDGWRLLAAWP